MKNTITMAALAWFITLGLPITSMADAKKGQRIFKKKLYKKCGFSGSRFSRTHTQNEWERIYEKGKFPQEAKKICPDLELDTVKEKWWADLYDFSHKYAKDGMVPNGCND